MLKLHEALDKRKKNKNDPTNYQPANSSMDYNKFRCTKKLNYETSTNI